jgi:hypothetical protein
VVPHPTSRVCHRGGALFQAERTPLGQHKELKDMFDTTFARRWSAVTGALLCAATTMLPAYADEHRDDGGRDAYAIGLWGDLPYNDVQAATGVPNLIADTNSQRLAFTVNDGDLKAGSGITGSTTPNGGLSLTERLDCERVQMFSTPYSLGLRKLRQ